MTGEQSKHIFISPEGGRYIYKGFLRTQNQKYMNMLF